MPSPYTPYAGDRTSAKEYPGSDLTPDAVEFGREMERWQREHDRRWPECWEVLQVARSLGYRKE